MTPDVLSREARLAAKQAVDSELTRARTQLARLRSERDAMVIAQRKGQLIARYDVKLALGFLLTGLRQRLMSLAYALPRRLAGQNEHAIGQIIDQEVRSALRDVASWPQKLGNPGWQEEVDADLMPVPEVSGNGDGGSDAIARRERANSKRRERYAKSKEDCPSVSPSSAGVGLSTAKTSAHISTSSGGHGAPGFPARHAS
jgi:hypothetical protein